MQLIINIWEFIKSNKEWLFSGIGVSLFVSFICLVRWLKSLKLIKIDKLGNGFEVNIGIDHTIQFVNGNLANVSCNEHEVVVLPVNNTFDSPCLKDDRSATGAFIKQHFPTGFDDIFEILQNAKESSGNTMIIPLSNPLGQKCNLFFIAATEVVSGKHSCLLLDYRHFPIHC